MKPFTSFFAILFFSLEIVLANGKYGMPKDCVVISYDKHSNKSTINLHLTSFYVDTLGNYYRKMDDDDYELIDDIDYADIVNIDGLDSLIEDGNYLIHESKGRIHIPIVIMPDTVDVFLDVGFGNWNANWLCGAHTFPLVSVKINSALLFDEIPTEDPDCNSIQYISSIHFDIIHKNVEVIMYKEDENTYELEKTTHTLDFNSLIVEPLKDLFSLK
jgi:hypothetical protein